VSDLPDEALTYQVVISEFFLGLRGVGLMLSPLDVELVRTWERRGIPVAIVCRGLRRGLEDALQHRGPVSPPPRALRAYRLAVEDEWNAYRRARVGDAPAPPDERTAAARRLQAGRDLIATAFARGDLPSGLLAAYEAAGSLLAAAPDDLGVDAVDAMLGRADALVLRHWLAGMSRADRARLGRRCAQHVGERAPWIRRHDHRGMLRAALGDHARAAGLLCLRGSV
jgi:hypothetical protein